MKSEKTSNLEVKDSISRSQEWPYNLDNRTVAAKYYSLAANRGASPLYRVHSLFNSLIFNILCSQCITGFTELCSHVPAQNHAVTEQRRMAIPARPGYQKVIAAKALSAQG